MPSNPTSPRLPSYRRHKPSGQAVVTLNGKDIYLGKWNTKASRREYDRLIGEWLAAGRCLPQGEAGLTEHISVAELCVRYLRWARKYYRKHGCPTGSMDRVRIAIRTLRQTYAVTQVQRFTPLALQAIQQKLVDSGKSRRYCNYLVQQIRRIFKWGVAQELVPETAYRALVCVPGLKRGRCEAHEPEPVRPVSDQVVDATLPHVSEVVADMVQFQRLTGCRPAEVCIIRPCDLDTSGDVWLYRPESHKTEHHDRERIICIGPRAQDVLRPYLLRPADSYCFSPVDSERKRLAELHDRRRTPLSCGNRPGTNRKRKPKKTAGEHYTTNSYRRVIHRACAVAFPPPEPSRRRKGETLEQWRARLTSKQHDELKAWQAEHRWSPNQLRHTAGTTIRQQYGLEAVQVVLGHATADVSQIYAERDLTLAAEVMRKIG